ncbi:MAG: inverse autotransporter beta domain-containing protein [Deltaproteobacteria bacterium]|uniref:Inverse autotransporter beta domain-containing protein n=1 Tax=Candidatus Zymogenus saltonus TaxID=2844893 RepID=A0A9D8PSB9_9DELT|nr:inverse autotransporter beta domain-containing protein [Candidatus Zymogenus saltonus]
MRPSVLFGSDGRVLYVMDMNIPIFQGEDNLLFAAPKFTPNNESSWEVNLGLGYRHILFDDSLMLGINAFYDYRKTPWGTKHTQWGVGAEVMAEFGILEDGGGLGLTGRFNYYQPLTDAVRVTYQ